MEKRQFFMNKLQLARTMMWAAILLIVAFQSYWINRLYREEREGLKKETNSIFREVVYNLQVERFKSDTHFFQSAARPNLFAYNAVNMMRKKAADLKKDTGIAKIRFDSISSMVFVNDRNSDTAVRGNGRTFSYSNKEMPAELKELIAKQQGTGGSIIIRRADSSTLRQVGQGMGFSMVVGRPKHPDSPGVRPEIKDNIVFRHPEDGRVLSRKDLPGGPRIPANAQVSIKVNGNPEKSFIRMITDGKPLDDTLSVTKLDSAYKKELSKANIPLRFSIKTGKDDSLHRRDTVAATQFATRPQTVGFFKPNWYQAELEPPTAFLLRKISPQILFSVFLAAFTTIAFIFLYRNLAAQRRLTEMKNDFISNITHELKTPIATVSVAVEALRNFGGIQSPERTKEYLDISASELQRLGLLVDKVLKLSLFENRELELKKETFDLKGLTEEVLNTMKLQFEKHHATVNLTVQGNYFAIDADRLHITSVIYNLLDNAMKYSKEKPEIDVRLRHETDTVVLEVADKGIGIADSFKQKIFDKFFRVPTGDHHNIKGYGLGLSYVAHVVKKHGGSISVNSEPGKGSTFTVKLAVA